MNKRLIGIDDATYVAPTLGDVLRARDEAWARLVKAEIDVADCVRGEIPGAYVERDAARQALRGLGVDVDALLD